PLSILLATIMTYGNLGEKNELFAMKSGGISLYRIMYPLFFLNLLISIVAFSFSNNLLPYTNLKMRTLLYNIQQQRPEINLQSGIFTQPVSDLSIKVERKKRKTNNLEDILIYDHRNKKQSTSITTAKQGSIHITEDKAFLILDLQDGNRYEDLDFNKNINNNKYPHQSASFKSQTAYIELDALGMDQANEDLFKNSFDMLNNKQLIVTIDSLKESLNKRKNDIYFNISEYSLFKGKHTWLNMNEDELEIANTEVDELSITDLKNIHVDSIFNDLNLAQKNKVLDFGLNYASSTKLYVELTKDELDGYKRYIARHRIEWHRKYVLAIACVLFYLIGAPLGAIIRKGGFGLPVIVSVFLFLIYYVISITFEKTTREAVFEPILGMWMSTYVLIPLAGFLIYKAATDSMRISTHFYSNLKSKFKRKTKRT
ncbi:MAG: LptF/LptG family permease, partial [Bacteroidales bacterium]|nr:LptF/LptG family permease [Bacteroidales bacterium]